MATTLLNVQNKNVLKTRTIMLTGIAVVGIIIGTVFTVYYVFANRDVMYLLAGLIYSSIGFLSYIIIEFETSRIENECKKRNNSSDTATEVC